jgi:hypothetical protein
MLSFRKSTQLVIHFFTGGGFGEFHERVEDKFHFPEGVQAWS